MTRLSVASAALALVRAPNFTAVTVLTLAVGIGASTAVFSAVDTVLLRPLPYLDPDAVASIEVEALEPPMRHTFVESLRVDPELFAAVGAWRLHRVTLTGEDEPTRAHVVHATEGLLERVLGVQPFLGRAFLAEEHRPDGARTVVLSHRFWKERMHGDPDVLGRAVGLDGVPYTVVGVMAEGFRPPFNGPAELWIPVALRDLRCAGDCEAYGALGRLSPGTTLPAAQARVAAVAQTVAGDPSGEVDASGAIEVKPLRQELEGGAAPTLWLLLLGVAAASVLAFVNIGVLNVARATERAYEFSIRRTLGARRSDFARQLLVEAGVLALCGTVAGCLLADWILEILSASAPSVLIGVDGIALDVPTLALTAALGSVSALVAGLAPVAVPVRAPATGRPATRHQGGRWIEWLMGGQVAVAMVLLVGAALLSRSLHEVNKAELGFDPHGLVALEVEVPSSLMLDGLGRGGLLEEARTRLLNAPGVVAAGGVSGLPMVGAEEKQLFALDTEDGDDRVQQIASLYRVTPGYFYTMGMRILTGRTFDADDKASTPAVAVVNERWARSFTDFPRSSPVGETLVQLVQGRPMPLTIVGVVSDIRQNGPKGRPEPAIYRAVPQDPPNRLMLVVEVDEPSQRIRSLRRTVASVHPGFTVTVLGPLDGLVDQSMRSERFAAGLAVLLAAAMLLIAAVGVYGTVRRVVLRRVRELGIRLSLGAGRADASRVALGTALRFAGIGVFIGLAFSWTASPLLGSLLFGVSPHDPRSVLFGLASTVAAGGLALWGPVRSVASVEPVEVLRE